MSHLVQMSAKVNDPAAVEATCRRLNLPAPTQGTARLYSAQATGLIVQLSEWQYPIVIDTVSGDVKYDNFSGHWGDQARLEQFLQIYAVEKAKSEARSKAYPVQEQVLQDGSIVVEIIERR